MKVEKTALEGVVVITPERHGDARGWMVESYSQEALRAQGVAQVFVQENHSFSARRGTLRGLHFQRRPRAQDKLVRVVTGAVLDVAVDVRRGSPTFGRHVAVELTAANDRQLLVPKGFAHGFVTLSDDTQVLYKVSDSYAPELEAGLAWDDPDVAIAWPFAQGQISAKPRDLAWPRLGDVDSGFRFDDMG